MLSATQNGRPAIAPADSQTNRYPGCDTAAQQTGAPEHNAGMMPSPSYSHYKLNAAWCDALPDSLRDTATAQALQAIADLDLDELAAIVPPRGYGRD